MASVKGSPEQALNAVKNILESASPNQEALERFAKLIDLIIRDSDSQGEIVLDFGLVHGLAYYNGVIFEVGHPM